MAISAAKEPSYRRKAALTAGISLIIMAIAAFFSFGFVHAKLVVQGDAGATYNNVTSSIMLFKAGLLGWVIVLITDIVVAWAFYIFLEPTNKNLSLLGAWLRLTYAAILGIAIQKLIDVQLLSTSTLSVFNPDQLHAEMAVDFEAFETMWSIGLIIFGGHLMIVGYLAFKSGSIPKVISILLLLASIGYIVIHLCKVFLAHQYEGAIAILEYVLMLPMVAGELGFGIWLLFRGGRASERGLQTR